ncbi:MAG: SDR family oxidoreductase [Rhodospirillaceae bacterium]|nr:SDR family oxidoreductase [Rhodospirillaceae bacterium]
MSKTMLITGASRGIGAACARLAAARGWDVAVNYAGNAEAADAVCAEVRACGRHAAAIQADVAEEAQVMALYDAVDRKFGRLDAVINNAGIVALQSRLEDMSGERIQRVLAVNVFGAFMVAREAVRRMSTERGGAGGAIVNMSSAASRIGSPNEYIDYAATKGAMDSMTIGLAREVAGVGVRVNAVRPGIIETEIHALGGEPGRCARMGPGLPIGRSGTAEEVAAVALWLVSDEASYVTGALVDVTGGR